VNDTASKTADASPGDVDLSICIISYNTRDMTLACIASVLRETCLSYEIIVVDNASTDGSAEAIAREYPDIHLIAEAENHGFARAHDIAVPACKGKYLLLLNPDTVVLNGAIDTLMTFAETRPNAKIWGGRTLFADGTLNPYSCWRRQTLWSVLMAVTGLSSIFPNSPLFNPEAYGGWKRDTERAVDIVTGCFLLMPRALWDDLGGFDPLFFMYGEEADLCLRARRLGARPCITPDAEIVHYGGVSEKVRADKMVRILKAKISLIDRHFAPATRWAGRMLLRLWPWSRMLATRVLDGSAGSDRAKTWADIWARRTEWWRGY
jgi:hypothetical protein